MVPSFLSQGFEAKSTFSAKDLSDTCLQHMKARRLGAGEKFILLNGAGDIFTCAVIDKKLSNFTVERREESPALRPEIELCVSPPKGDDLWQLITQATEIGATSLVFVRSDHNQHPSAAKQPPADRAQRVSDAACEQCARPWLLRIDSEWRELSSLLPDSSYSHWVADEALAGKTDKQKVTGQKIRLYVGPEGGWSARERQIFDEAKCHRFSLGPLVLRVPTAGVAAIHHLRWLSEHGG